MITSFRDLVVYKESFDLQLEIENLLKTYPADEKYLLVDQTKRSTRAIPALIAEGWAKRESIKEFQKFIRDAIGEANEIIHHLSFSSRKGYIKSPFDIESLINRYEKLISRLENLKNNWQNYK